MTADEQGISKGFDSSDRPSYLTRTGFKLSIFGQCDLEIQWMTSKNNRAPPLYYVKHCASFQSHQLIQAGVAIRKSSIRVKTGDFFVLCDLEIWRMTLKNNRAPLLYYVKLCASFQRHLLIQTRVTVWKCSISAIFLSHVTLKFDRWP